MKLIGIEYYTCPEKLGKAKFSIVGQGFDFKQTDTGTGWILELYQPCNHEWSRSSYISFGTAHPIWKCSRCFNETFTLPPSAFKKGVAL